MLFESHDSHSFYSYNSSLLNDDFAAHRNSPTSIICFSVSTLFLCSHTSIVYSMARLRRIYGVELIICLSAMCLFYATMLGSVFVTDSSPYPLCVVVGHVTHGTLITIPVALLVACVRLCWLFRRIQYLFYAATWRGNIVSIGFIVVCTATLVLLPSQIPWKEFAEGSSNLTLSESYLVSLHPDYGSENCSVGCIQNYLVPVFVTSMLLYLLLCPFFGIAFKWRENNESIISAAQHETAANEQSENTSRLFMCGKLGLSNCIIVFCTFSANYLCISMMWHLLSIVSTLQSIFIAINFTFSRSFLMVFLRPHGEFRLKKKTSSLLLCQSGTNDTQNSPV